VCLEHSAQVHSLAGILETQTMSITYLRGDATSPAGNGNKIIAHVCNDRGGWGKGFVLALSRRWSAPEDAYRAWARGGENFELGQLQLVQVEPALWVANMIAQHDTKPGPDGPPIRYEALRACLEKLAAEAVRLAASVHMPRIGCGLAGGKWEEIELLIEATLGRAGVSVTVYDLPV
jgi:O-acetyl-ADP-ribose deacetylase (regulator of RNase III)